MLVAPEIPSSSYSPAEGSSSTASSASDSVTSAPTQPSSYEILLQVILYGLKPLQLLQVFLCRTLKTMCAYLMTVAAESAFLLLKPLTPVLKLVLRILVRNESLCIGHLLYGYHDTDHLTSAIVNHHRLLQLVKGWEQGMINFYFSRLSRLTDVWGMFKLAWSGSESATSATAKAADLSARASGGTTPCLDSLLAQQLALACASGKLKVLIIHGKQDRIVPLEKSLRLAQMLPGCKVVLYDGCGHSPQIEMPLEFVKDVAEFVISLKGQVKV